uniref:G_PROTEIN_RECEP_F1_2 domain-containing protein n=1 Tax=Trichobilharzia regenti TaxID=157069 RepID=A0AA85K8W4_TRIRE|nr:unnamed protein product [Trichobilharzia regenti]
MFISCILVFINEVNCTHSRSWCLRQHKTKQNEHVNQEKQSKHYEVDRRFPFRAKNTHQIQSKKYFLKSIQLTVMSLSFNNSFIDIILFPTSIMMQIFPKYDLAIYSFIKYIFNWTMANNFTFSATLSMQLYLISDSLKQSQGVQCLRKYCLINTSGNNSSFKLSYAQIFLIWFTNAGLYAILPLYLDLIKLSRPSINTQSQNLSLLAKFSCIVNSCLVKYLHIFYTLLSFSQLVVSLIFLHRVHALIICVKNLIHSTSNEIPVDSMIKNIEIKSNSSFITSIQSKISNRSSTLKFNALLEYTRGIWIIRLYGISVLLTGLLCTLQNLLKSFDFNIDFNVTSLTSNLLLLKTLSDPILLTYGFKSLRVTMFDICSLCHYCDIASEKYLSSTFAA